MGSASLLPAFEMASQTIVGALVGRAYSWGSCLETHLYLQWVCWWGSSPLPWTGDTAGSMYWVWLCGSPFFRGVYQSRWVGSVKSAEECQGRASGAGTVDRVSELVPHMSSQLG